MPLAFHTPCGRVVAVPSAFSAVAHLGHKQSEGAAAVAAELFSVFDFGFVSRVQRGGGAVVLLEDRSSNGTFLNGVRVPRFVAELVFRGFFALKVPGDWGGEIIFGLHRRGALCNGGTGTGSTPTTFLGESVCAVRRRCGARRDPDRAWKQHAGALLGARGGLKSWAVLTKVRARRVTGGLWARSGF